jgi:hypothetical protein
LTSTILCHQRTTVRNQITTRSLLSRSRVDWAIEAARRVGAKPVGALGEAGLRGSAGAPTVRMPAASARRAAKVIAERKREGSTALRGPAHSSYRHIGPPGGVVRSAVVRSQRSRALARRPTHHSGLRERRRAQIRSDKIVGFHDATRHVTLRNSAMLGPSHPDTKARCAAMMNTPL